MPDTPILHTQSLAESEPVIFTVDEFTTQSWQPNGPDTSLKVSGLQAVQLLVPPTLPRSEGKNPGLQSHSDCSVAPVRRKVPEFASQAVHGPGPDTSLNVFSGHAAHTATLPSTSVPW